MVPITAEILFIFIIGYLYTISADDDCVTEMPVPEDCSVCGFGSSEHTAESMIKDGESMMHSRSFPWLVSLRTSANINFCGGAILDEYFILTAAHCVVNDAGVLKYDTKVHFQTESEKWLSKGADIEKIIVHPKFDVVLSSTTHVLIEKYDIALLKLKKKIKCDQYKKSLCLPSPDLKIPLGEVYFIAGWRMPDSKSSEMQTEVLYHGIGKHLNFEKCIQVVPETKSIRDHMLCLGETGKATCFGDSGAPSIAKINNNYTVVGIASSETKQHCPNNSPMIYTNVAKFVNWIKKQQKALLKSSLLEGRKQTERQKIPRWRFKERKHNRNNNRRIIYLLEWNEASK